MWCSKVSVDCTCGVISLSHRGLSGWGCSGLKVVRVSVSSGRAGGSAVGGLTGAVQRGGPVEGGGGRRVLDVGGVQVGVGGSDPSVALARLRPGVRAAGGLQRGVQRALRVVDV